MKQKIKDFGNKILNLMYPNSIKCMFCAEELNQNEYNCTCENCLASLPFIKNGCVRCGSPMNENQHGVCIKCKKRNFYFSQAKSIFVYEGVVAGVVQQLKYNQKQYIAEKMVKYLTDEFATWNLFPDVITSVPMFSTKEKIREYNQSKILAEKFALDVKIPFCEICEKIVDTPSQTSLNTKERLENVRDSFKIKDEFKKGIKDKIILIIDDVITTGATTSEISRVLINGGAKECYVLSFAHARINQIEYED